MQADLLPGGGRLTAGTSHRPEAADARRAPEARAWIDGGARGNPGPAGFGVIFELPSRNGHGEDGEIETIEIAGYLGETTNNVAEYTALLAALAYAREHGLGRLSLHSDSELLVKQMAGTYKVKAPHLVPLYQRALRLKYALESVALRHVRREQNRRADALANQAMDSRQPPPAWLAAHLP